MPFNFTLQSTLHAGIIMDGNGRWALARGLPRVAGHYAGVEAARRVVEAAPGTGVGVLTLFAFSSDNWRRRFLGRRLRRCHPCRLRHRRRGSRPCQKKATWHWDLGRKQSGEALLQ